MRFCFLVIFFFAWIPSVTAMNNAGVGLSRFSEVLEWQREAIKTQPLNIQSQRCVAMYSIKEDAERCLAMEASSLSHFISLDLSKVSTSMQSTILAIYNVTRQQQSAVQSQFISSSFTSLNPSEKALLISAQASDIATFVRVYKLVIEASAQS